jgi:hypothetical protein
MTIDHDARYRAYANYLIALSGLIKQEYPGHADLINTLAEYQGIQRLSRSNEIDRELLARALRHSWFTELLLHETNHYSNLLPYAIPWSMVQVYYTIHSALRAYFLACRRQVEPVHETALRTIGSDLVSYKERFPPPWNCVLTGDPRAAFVYLSHTPESIAIDLHNALLPPAIVDPWQHYGLFLKTTRLRQTERAIRNWKKTQHKQRISQMQRQTIVQAYRPTTLFDALYRIRARANYKDIDSFIFSATTPLDYAALQTALCHIVQSTLLIFEVIIVKSLGKQPYADVLAEFMSTPWGTAAARTAFDRWTVIDSGL